MDFNQKNLKQTEEVLDIPIDNFNKAKENRRSFVFALLAVLSGAVAFVFSFGFQLNIYMLKQLNSSLDPSVIVLGTSYKVFIMGIALCSILLSFLYFKSKHRKMIILNYLSIILSITSIILVFFPLFRF